MIAYRGAMIWRHAMRVCGVRGAGQDRAAVIAIDGGLVIALADGAGGTGAGDVAAQAIVDAAVAAVAAAPTGPSWAAFLDELDGDPARLGHGQATAVLVTVTAAGIRGASVGDSGAWLVRGDAIDELTAQQQRKPLVGAGGAMAIALGCGPIGEATLVVASDGLLKYGARRAIARIAGQADLAAAADALIELVRLPSGGLQDDVGVVLCRQ